MTTLDEICLVFVGVCTAGIAYLIIVEPVRERLRGSQRQTKKPKH